MSKYALKYDGFVAGEEFDLLDLARKLPGYFSPSLVALLEEAAAKPPQAFTVTVTSITYGEGSDD